MKLDMKVIWKGVMEMTNNMPTQDFKDMGVYCKCKHSKHRHIGGRCFGAVGCFGVDGSCNCRKFKEEHTKQELINCRFCDEPFKSLHEVSKHIHNTHDVGI